MAVVVATLNLHALLPRSRANGPGERFVVWTQGCPLDCPGCCNPATHAVEPRLVIPVDALAERIEREAPTLEGLTLSGGEPLEQAEPLLALLTRLRQTTPLGVILFSGHRLAAIRCLPHGEALLRNVDLLVDGRFVTDKANGTPFQGSDNQRHHFLTDRYTPQMMAEVPDSEVIIQPDGQVMISGVNPPAPLF